MKILGLRARRLRAWWRVVADRPPTARQWGQMFWVLFRRRPAGVVTNYRKCVRCPMHEPTAHVCIVCGCYMPYKLAAGGGCAAREIDPESPLGF